MAVHSHTGNNRFRLSCCNSPRKVMELGVSLSHYIYILQQPCADRPYYFMSLKYFRALILSIEYQADIF